VQSPVDFQSLTETRRCAAIRDHHRDGISDRDPEFDSPLPVFKFLLYPCRASRCNLVGIQPIQPRFRLGCIAALPRLRRKGTCSPVPGARPDQSRSCFARDRDPGFTRAPMLTGAPNKARGRSKSTSG
jgi:hypothetical protein